MMNGTVKYIALLCIISALSFTVVAGLDVLKASGQEAPSVWVDPADIEVEPEEIFTVDIVVDATGQQLRGISVEVGFDDSVLITSTGSITAYNLLGGMAIGPTLENGTISYATTSFSPVPDVSGTLMTVQFKVKHGAPSGDYPIQIVAQMNDENNQPIEPLNITDGVVTVSGDPTVDIFVKLQGDNRPAAGWEVPISVGFFPANCGEQVMSGSSQALYWFEGTTSGTATESGTRAYFQCPDPISPGIYDITADSETTLMNVRRAVSIP